MIKQKSTIQSQQKALDLITAILHDVEYFVFFGTLLGLTREGNPIEGDDDIDCYVDISNQSKLINALGENGITINRSVPWNQTEHFFQVFVETDLGLTAVDFYFYDPLVDKQYIWEKWNFHGTPHNHDTWMKTPKPFIFPIQKEKFGNMHIPVPNKKILCCEWLYGSSWKVPKKKKLEYQMRVFSGKPLMFERDANSKSQSFNLSP